MDLNFKMTEAKTFSEAWIDLQNDLISLKKGETNPHFQSQYVDLNAVLSELKSKCPKHGITFFQTPQIVDGKSVLITSIHYKDKEVFTGMMELVARDASDPQKLGGALTYMRRYSLMSMFNLETEDDDGNEANAKKPVAKSAPKPFVRTPDNSAADAPKVPEGALEPGAFGVIGKNAEHGVCERCGAPNKISAAGRKYCSDLCWKK